MSASDTHISCTSLSFSWPDGTEVLSGFDLAVGPGRTGLIGLNGCGKSTLLRLIAGELPRWRARSGPAANSGTCRRP